MAWADSQPVTGNGKLSKAINYIRNRRNAMFMFLEDERCSLSNNPSENSIRPVTVGRKNWLFSKSVEGAEASMGIYTIVETAKLYGLNRYKAEYESFLKTFKQPPDSLEEFSIDSGNSLVEYATVYSTDDIRFTFKNGLEIKA